MQGSSLKKPLHRYGVALLLVAAAAAIRLMLLQPLGLRAPYITFFPAVMLAALYGGLWAGLLATVLSSLASAYFWIEPLGYFSIGHPADLLGMATFLINGVLISGISEAMHRAQARARAAEAEVKVGVERKRAEDALRESDERLRSLFDNMLNGFAYCKMLYDENGRPADFLYLDVNSAFGKLTGLEGVTCKKVTDVIPGVKESHPELFEIYGRVASTGQAEKFEIDFRPLRLSFSISVYSTERGYFVAVFEDITERKLAEKELRRHRDSLEELVEERTAELVEQSRVTEAFLKHSASPLVFLDDKFNFIRVNDAYARICARDVSDFAGHNHFIDYPSDELKGKFERVVETKEPYSVLARPFVFPDHPEWGTTYWDLYVYPIIDDKGDIDFLVFSLNDITDRKRAEDEALRVHKLESLRVLAGGIAHDLNNLMVAVSANAGLALDKLGTESSAAEHIQAIEDASEKVAAFSKQILSFTGRSEAVKEPVQLNDVVEDTARLVMASVSPKARFEYNLSGALPPIMADPMNMQQVVMNLIINAAEALGDAGGTIRVSTGMLDARRTYLDSLHPAGRPEGAYVCLEVSDTGCGISPETRKRIFDPFFSTKFTGRGLGLSAVFGIVHSHGGAIGLTSEAGRGSTFTVLLPVPESPVAVVREEPAARVSLSGKGTILVVDDEINLLDMAKTVLETYGYDVITASDGTEAVRVFSERPGLIDAVIMDLIMPRVRGDQAAREMRKVRDDVNIVFLSGYHELDLDEFCGGPGRTAFLEKPYKVAKLLGAVQDMTIN